MSFQILRAPDDRHGDAGNSLPGQGKAKSIPLVAYLIVFGLPAVFMIAGGNIYLGSGERFGLVFAGAGLAFLLVMLYAIFGKANRPALIFDNGAAEVFESHAPDWVLLRYSDLAGFSARTHTYKGGDGDGRIVTHNDHVTELQTRDGFLIPIETHGSLLQASELAEKLAQMIPYSDAPLPSEKEDKYASRLTKGGIFHDKGPQPYVELVTRPAYSILGLASVLFMLVSLAVPVEKLGLRPWLVAIGCGTFPWLVSFPFILPALGRWRVSRDGDKISVDFRGAIGSTRHSTCSVKELTGAFYTSFSHGVEDALVLWRGPLPPLAPFPQPGATSALDAESDAAIPISVAAIAGRDRFLFACRLLQLLRAPRT